MAGSCTLWSWEHGRGRLPHCILNVIGGVPDLQLHGCTVESSSSGRRCPKWKKPSTAPVWPLAGSPLVFTGGLVPSRRAVQLGRHQNPSLSSRWDATCRSDKQPVAGASCSMVRATMSATAGVRWLIISRASANMRRQRIARPQSIRIGSLATISADLSSSSEPGNSLRRPLAVSHTPLSCPRAYSWDKQGGNVLIVWLARGLAL